MAVVPDLIGVKAQHCATVLFTDNYSEVNGYRGFTKEVLFSFFFFYLFFFFLGVIILILRAFPHPPSLHKQNVMVLPSNEKFCVINVTEELF